MAIVSTDFAAYCVIAMSIAGFVLGYTARSKYRPNCNECKIAEVHELTDQAAKEHDAMHRRYGRCTDDSCPRNH